MSSLIIQSDYTIVLEKSAPTFKEDRDFLLKFAELEKCLEYLYNYRITRLSLWNAVSLGFGSEKIITGLKERSKYPIPKKVEDYIYEICSLFGSVEIQKSQISGLIKLVIKDKHVLEWIISAGALEKLLFNSRERLFSAEWNYENCSLMAGCKVLEVSPEFSVELPDELRGDVKIILIDNGIPVNDIAGYRDGDPLAVSLKTSLHLRPYQEEAVHAFYQNGTDEGGSGVLCLPCGAGKTIIGISCIAKLGLKTLIVTPNITAARQWKAELLDKTDLREEDIGEYSGLVKEVRPVTLCTYQILTTGRGPKAKSLPRVDHLAVINSESWGFVICDEVHLLPAPLFKMVANIQSSRRLGLTATLVREDNKEHHVFSLIGPKKYDVPWKILEDQGWVANAECIEIKVEGSHLVDKLAFMKKSEAFRVSSENGLKTEIVSQLLSKHKADSVLIIGMYVEQLEKMAKSLDIPIMHGQTKQKDREKLFKAFKNGEIKTLIVSKVANNAVDLPDASVAIQVSGMFGSRQEEAQRLGRILRPKKGANKAYFYSLVTEGSPEEEFAFKRQLFLVEQGYQYSVMRAS